MPTGKASLLNNVRLGIYAILCFPHIILLHTHREKTILKADIFRWLKELKVEHFSLTKGFIYLLARHPEFRNLFYYRAGSIRFLLNLLCPRMSTLYITTESVGEGLYIQHGFATVIAARSIGRNCWINQQVTIGFSNSDDCPVLEDNVTVNAGAKVIGGITIGANSHIGANAVVVKNVPKNCVVVGVPAYIIKRDGVKVREPL